MDKPLILVTNDDGIDAPGLRFLINLIKGYGDVVVVASEKTNSGMSHAITIETPLRITNISKGDNYTEYSCNGSPVDCVKLAEHALLPRKPDLLVSGINHGSNASVNIIYSGTMAAVLEGAMIGIPSVGFSLLDYSKDADFSATKEYVKVIVEKVLKNSLPSGVCLNVNFPIAPKSELKGIKVCRQAKGIWNEEFVKKTDPRNNDYYWLTGSFDVLENSDDTDLWALKNNYVSVVPVHFDFTSHKSISLINNWKLNV